MTPFLIAAALTSCPNLSGKFNCPAYGTQQPPSVLTVTQAEDATGVTTYTYAFDIYPNTSSDSRASVAGLIDQGLLKFCSGDKLFLGNITGTSAGSVQAHFINADGDYVVTRADREVMHCVKAAE